MDEPFFTIGHSTRALDEFLHLLKAHDIRQLADVRTVPRSRRHPHFVREALSESLAAVGIVYRHMPGLGGLRKPRPDSRNTAWRVEGFRGYADYMETRDFERALGELIEWASSATSCSGDARAAHGERVGRGGGAPRTVIMCAEAVWWRCHRQLIADALVARGFGVLHISSESAAKAHTLTAYARLKDGRVTYPGVG